MATVNINSETSFASASSLPCDASRRETAHEVFSDKPGDSPLRPWICVLAVRLCTNRRQLRDNWG